MLIFAIAVVLLNLGGVTAIINRREKIYGEMTLSNYGLVFFMTIAITLLMLIFSFSVAVKNGSWLAVLGIPGAGLAAMAAFFMYQESGIRALLAQRRAQAEEALKKTLEFISQRPDSIPALENLSRLYDKLGKAELSRLALECARKVQAREDAAVETARSDERRTL